MKNYNDGEKSWNIATAYSDVLLTTIITTPNPMSYRPCIIETTAIIIVVTITSVLPSSPAAAWTGKEMRVRSSSSSLCSRSLRQE